MAALHSAVASKIAMHPHVEDREYRRFDVIAPRAYVMYIIVWFTDDKY